PCRGSATASSSPMPSSPAGSRSCTCSRPAGARRTSSTPPPPSPPTDPWSTSRETAVEGQGEVRGRGPVAGGIHRHEGELVEAGERAVDDRPVVTEREAVVVDPVHVDLVLDD